MEKRIYMMLLILMVGLGSGCGKGETESNDLLIESIPSQGEERILQAEIPMISNSMIN